MYKLLNGETVVATSDTPIVWSDTAAAWAAGPSFVSDPERVFTIEHTLTAAEALVLLAELDAQFDPRWFEDLVTGSPMHDRYVAWSSRREELREIIRNG